MTAFLLDLWHDLRRKRLWPVALVLAIAAVAIPLALIRPVPEGPSDPPASATEDTAPVVSLSDEPQAGSSKLDRFGEEDPFETPGGKKGILEGEGSEQPEIGGGSGDSTGDGVDALTATGEGSDASGGDPPPSVTGTPVAGSSGGAASGGGSPSGGAPGGGAPSGGGNPPEPKEEKFTYEVDVDFGPRGSVREFDGVATLDPLTEGNPRLLFLGVVDDAKRAAFSVLDPEVDERGDGKCLEFGDRCAVLYLKVGEKHTFVETDDDRYEIRLRAINEVRLDG